MGTDAGFGFGSSVPNSVSALGSSDGFSRLLGLPSLICLPFPLDSCLFNIAVTAGPEPGKPVLSCKV